MTNRNFNLEESNDKIVDLQKSLKTIYPNIKLNKSKSDCDNHYITLDIEKNDCELSIKVFRDDIKSNSYYHIKYAMKVSIDMYGIDNKVYRSNSNEISNFSGLKLRKDILDPKFNINTIVKQITKAIELFENLSEYTKAHNEYQNEQEVKKKQLEKRLSENGISIDTPSYIEFPKIELSDHVSVFIEAYDIDEVKVSINESMSFDKFLRIQKILSE